MRCVYCGKTNKTHEKISFHRFPKDGKLVKIWVKNMGRLDFVPKPWHLLCVEHFAENCIDFRDLRARLRKGSVPTIFKDNKENLAFPSDTELHVRACKQMKLDGSLSGQEVAKKDLPTTTRLEIEGLH
ncbi:THAP domain-containing protein 2-like [Fopius arisanus]|uniref:THAP domain-containing protein 2-like n=1 Tax=Fopius arisanus TaxID=64838 RepID=A0A9R1U979_9HYME|nr:PREDICTED: THAP domain-containing protein 2-like [Fopius arisanus]